jgi:hypothetical protein
MRQERMTGSRLWSGRECGWYGWTLAASGGPCAAGHHDQGRAQFPRAGALLCKVGAWKGPVNNVFFFVVLALVPGQVPNLKATVKPLDSMLNLPWPMLLQDALPDKLGGCRERADQRGAQ